MNGRLIAGVVALVVLFPVTAGLLFDEQIAGAVGEQAAEGAIVDPLGGLQFVKGKRESNLEQMGFAAAEVAEIVTRVETLERKLSIGDPANDVIKLLIDKTDDQTILENGLCGRSNPARYTALQLLVEEQGEELRVRDLFALPGFEVMGWYAKDRPVAMVPVIELVENREADATRMGLGAVFARQVPTVLEGKAPWGPALFRNWSWDDVRKKWPGVDGKVQAYVANLHLLLENVTAEGGLCRTD